MKAHRPGQTPAPALAPSSAAPRLAGRAVLVVMLVLVVLMVLARLSGLGKTWWFELLAYLPYPLLLVPAMLVFLWSWWLGAGWWMAGLLNLLLVLTVLMGLSVGTPDSGSGRVRLMTYNVKSYVAERAQGYAPLVLEVVTHDPDIIVMQDAAQLIAQRQLAAGSVQGIYANRQAYAFGQYLILSRFALHDCGHDDISYRDETHSFARCTFSAHGREVDLITAHFKTPRDGLNAARHERLQGLAEWRLNFEDRLAQAVRLAQGVRVRPRPVIIAGDLNAPEHSAVIQHLLEAGFRDAWSSCAIGYGYTYGHSFKPHLSFLRIDHVLISAELGVQGCEVGGPQASDHRPVVVDLLMHRDP